MQGRGERLADRPALRPDQQIDVRDLVAVTDQGLAHHEGTRHTRLSSVVGQAAATATAAASRSCARRQAIRWREWRSRRRGGAARTPRRAPAEPRGGRRRRAARVRARGRAPRSRATSRPRHDFADTSYEDMLRSAIALGPELGAGGRARRRRHRARRRAGDASASRGANTNLGIALLLAPLARAALTGGPLRERAGATVLAALTLDDARAAYAAIRAGRRRAASTSPSSTTCATSRRSALREAMAAAAERDTIAAEYATGYAADVRARAARARRRAGRRAARRATPIVELCLAPARRGARHADRAQARAPTRPSACRRARREVLAAGGVRTARAGRRWRRSTPRCARDGNALNPGTTADLVTAVALRRAAEGAGL